jgi:hypothetical protein
LGAAEVTVLCRHEERRVEAGAAYVAAARDEGGRTLVLTCWLDRSGSRTYRRAFAM